MNIPTDMMSGEGIRAGAAGGMGGINSFLGRGDVPLDAIAPADTVELSNAGQMISVGIGLAREGNADVQDFMNQLEQGVRSGVVDTATLMAEVPEELASALDSAGIELEDALQTISEHAANQPPPVENQPEGEMLPEEEGNAEAAHGAGAGGAKGAGGATESSEDDSDAIDELEEQISELQQEITALQGKELTEEVEGQLSAKQAELAAAQAALSLLESEESDS
jgi:hypothetical protein